MRGDDRMNDKPKHSITDVIRFLEDRQLEQDWDIRRDAIQYLREYAEKKDDLDELIKKEALETYKAVRITSILADMLEEKTNKCTKLNCPMQASVVPPDCNNPDCPFRTDNNVNLWLKEHGILKK